MLYHAFTFCGTDLMAKSHTLLFSAPKTSLGDGGELQMELDVAIAAVHRASFMSRYDRSSSPAARHITSEYPIYSLPTYERSIVNKFGFLSKESDLN